MVIRFNKITLFNFGSFLGLHELAFDPSGLYIVNSKNLDTNGESGGGKTTLFRSLAYVLGLCSVSAKELQTWHSEEPFWVRLDLTINNEQYSILKGPAEAKIDGPEKASGAHACNELIKRLFNLTSDQIKTIVYHEQNGDDYFLNKTNAEKKQFLYSLLNLSVYEDIVSSDKLNAQVIEKQIEDQKTQDLRIENELTFIKKELFSYENLPAKIIEAKNELDIIDNKRRLAQDTLKCLKDEKDLKLIQIKNSLSEKYDDLVFPINSKLNNLQTEVKGISLLLETKKKDLNDRIYQAKSQIKDISTAKSKAVDLKTQLSKLQVEIEHLKSHICPFCKRNWEESQTDLIANNENRANLLLEDIVKINKTVDKEADIQTVLKELQENGFGDLKVQIDTKDSEIAFLQAQISQLLINKKGEENQAILESINQIKETERTLAFIESNFSTNENNFIFLKKQESSLKSLIKRQDELALELVNNDQATQGLTKRLAYYKERTEFINSFLNYIIYDTLNEISNESNKILLNIPNVSHVTVSFDVEKNTQKGVKLGIVTKTFFNGIEKPYKSGCSGGMLASLKLAIDLAIKKVLSQRAEVYIKLIIFDEQMSGLDTLSKTSYLDILKAVAQDILVLIVEHDVEFKEQAEKSISIIKKEDRSCFE